MQGAVETASDTTRPTHSQREPCHHRSGSGDPQAASPGEEQQCTPIPRLGNGEGARQAQGSPEASGQRSGSQLRRHHLRRTAHPEARSGTRCPEARRQPLRGHRGACGADWSTLRGSEPTRKLRQTGEIARAANNKDEEHTGVCSPLSSAPGSDTYRFVIRVILATGQSTRA